MKFKNIILSAITLLFIWSVMSISYMNGTNITDTKLAFSYGFIDFLIMTLAMMIMPAIGYFKNGGLFEFERGKKLCQRNIWIALGVLFVKDIILLGGIYGEVLQNLGSNMVYSLIYYLINKTLFVSDVENVKKVVNNKITEDKKKVDKYVVNSFVEEENEIVVQEIEKKELGKNSQKSSFCAKCGGKLDDSKKCTKCGKQYFYIKFINKKYLIVMLLIIIASIGVNTLLISNLNEYKKEYENENSILKDEIKYLESANSLIKKISEGYQADSEFLNENIAIVIQGYGNYYYTYDCVQKMIGDEEYSFRAYNIPTAIAQGYKKGSCN